MVRALQPIHSSNSVTVKRGVTGTSTRQHLAGWAWGWPFAIWLGSLLIGGWEGGMKSCVPGSKLDHHHHLTIMLAAKRGPSDVDANGPLGFLVQS